MPDPLFTQNAANIRDVEYPRTTVVGTWVTMKVSPIQTPSLDLEVKCFYELNSGGGGKMRQAVVNHTTKGKIGIEASISWSYLGNNHWKISLPSSDKFKVTDNRGGWEVGAKGAQDIFVRYHEGRLYEGKTGSVWVRAEHRAVKDMTERLRSQPPILRVTMPE